MFFGIMNTMNAIEINLIVQNTLIFSSTLQNSMSYTVIQNVILKSTVSILPYFKIGPLNKNDGK